jgi:hypothetical protein
VAAYLLNVRLAFHPENVSTVYGMNVVAAEFVGNCPKQTQFNTVVYQNKRMDRVGVEPTTSAMPR